MISGSTISIPAEMSAVTHSLASLFCSVRGCVRRPSGPLSSRIARATYSSGNGLPSAGLPSFRAFLTSSQDGSSW